MCALFDNNYIIEVIEKEFERYDIAVRRKSMEHCVVNKDGCSGGSVLAKKLEDDRRNQPGTLPSFAALLK